MTMGTSAPPTGSTNSTPTTSATSASSTRSSTDGVPPDPWTTIPTASSTPTSSDPPNRNGPPDFYIADWHNPIIGHMQHNLRDTSRDRLHGRIYRVSYDSARAAPPMRLDNATPQQLVRALTNAAGGIRRTFRAGDLMLIRDHLNLMFRNPLIGALEAGTILVTARL